MTLALIVAYSCAASRSAHSIRIRMGEWNGRKSSHREGHGRAGIRPGKMKATVAS